MKNQPCLFGVRLTAGLGDGDRKEDSMIEAEPRWSIKKTERMLVVNLCVGVVVMLLNLVTTVAILLNYQRQTFVLSEVADLRQRIVVLEERLQQQSLQPPSAVQITPADKTKE